MKKVIVTGGSGFIGTNMVDHLLKRGYEVINIDKQEPQNKSHLQYWKNVNILDKEDMENIIRTFSPQYIIHLAARCDLDGKKLEDYNENIDGVKNLIEICNDDRIPLEKILVTSSMLVCNPGYLPKNQKDYHPHTVYGESKVLTEKITWDANLNCDWAIIRPTSIWGPWFDEPYRNFFDMIIKGMYVHIGHKSATMTYGYVGNIVKQIEDIMLTDTTNMDNKVFNLGDYEPTNLEEWANEVAKEIDKRIIRIPYSIVKIGAIFGDILGKINVKFPLTSFRLRNMITNNVLDLSLTKKISQTLPYSRKQGVHATLEWMKNSGNM